MNTGLGNRAARWVAMFSLLLVAIVATGCATTSGTNGATQTADNPDDPIEGFNRGVFTVNDKLDRAVFKPVAQGYEKVLPEGIRSCISNIFGNIGDVPASLNNFLQGKFRDGSSDICRIGVNTTIGVGGCFDIASKWGLEKHNEDFGQTLGVWGIPPGPYLVLPLFGPSTFRDAPALIVDTYMDPTHYIPFVAPRNSLYGVRLVDKRAQALDTTNFIDNAALDPYVFVRDAYLARRRSLVLDGREPPPATGGPATR
jgi:phospholipid-binding lipoprotein MlaA